MVTDESVSDLANRVLARARQAARALPTGGAPTARKEPTYSSARTDDRDPATMADAIVSLVTDRGWQAATSIGKIWGEWVSLVGPTLAEHVKPEAFDRNTGLLTLRDTAGAELSSVDVGEGAQLLTPTHDGALLALSTGSAPLVLITLRAGVPWLVGAVRPDGDLAGATFHPIAQPQWRYQLLAKGADGVWLDLRGVSTALAGDAPGVPLEGSLPPRPWEVAPEITRA